jgi:hypothetical protein
VPGAGTAMAAWLLVGGKNNTHPGQVSVNIPANQGNTNPMTLSCIARIPLT